MPLCLVDLAPEIIELIAKCIWTDLGFDTDELLSLRLTNSFIQAATRRAFTDAFFWQRSIRPDPVKLTELIAVSRMPEFARAVTRIDSEFSQFPYQDAMVANSTQTAVFLTLAMQNLHNVAMLKLRFPTSWITESEYAVDIIRIFDTLMALSLPCGLKWKSICIVGANQEGEVDGGLCSAAPLAMTAVHSTSRGFLQYLQFLSLNFLASAN